MFFHHFKYDFLTCIRNRGLIFWLILFPAVLGTLFKVAFSGIYDSVAVFKAIPVAIVTVEENAVFDEVISAISEGDEALFTVTEADEATALEMLETKQVTGIIYVAEKLSLTVGNAETMNSSAATQQSIIKGFVEQYEIQKNIIMDTVTSSPENLEAVIEAMSADIVPNTIVKRDNTGHTGINTLTIKNVYNSWIAEKILNFNSDLYYQSREYIALSYKEGHLLIA